MTFDDVLARFPGARRSGAGYMVRCPAHEDREASLHITRTAESTCLLHCHAGCSTEIVVRAAGLTMRDLFLKASSEATRATRARIRKRRPVVVKGDAHPQFGEPSAIYTYTDINGVCVYQTCRFTRAGGRKTFRPRQAVKDGYLWTLDHIETGSQIALVVYRRHDLLRAMQDGHPAWTCIVEGEKDADRLWSLNIAATTNVGGAGKWRDEFAQQLIVDGVTSVYVLPDHDEPGQRHADTVAQSCHAAGLEVRLVTLPKLPEKKGADVSDWLDAGHTADELRAVLEHVPIWTADAAATVRPSPIAGAATEPATLDQLFERCGLSGLSTSDGSLEKRLCALQAALVGAEPIRRTLAREMLTAVLKSAGVKAPAMLADATLPNVQGTQTDASGLSLTDDTPWPDDVDGALLLDALTARLGEHLVLPPRGATAIALWILHTYLMHVWQLSPLLTFTSPTRRCGKSTAAMLVTSLCPRKLLASNVTAAVLFRTVDSYRPTLCIDEADTLLRDHDELRSVINAGYLKQTACVPRCVGDDHRPTLLSSWAAKIIVMIGSPPDTIADRSVLISMKRRTPEDRVARLRADQLESRALMLRRQATRWAVDHAAALVDVDPNVPDVLHDRAADNWRPLLALADEVGGHWPQTARVAALALSGEIDTAAEAASVLLLSDIRDWFDDQDAATEVAPSPVLVKHLTSLETRPWLELSKGKPLSPVSLSRMLHPYGIGPTTVRQGAVTLKGYVRRDFLDAWSRYLTTTSRNTCNTPIDTGGIASPRTVTRTRAVTGGDRENGNDSGPCYGVAGRITEHDDEVRL